MPELPEVENVRRSLERLIVGRTVQRVRIGRADIVRRQDDCRSISQALLQGGRIAQIRRHGKQLAIICDDGRSMCVHLGMSGQLRVLGMGERLPDATHVHIAWLLDRGCGRMVFRDPRRFGGVWTFSSFDELQTARWSSLGPDALPLRAATLKRILAGSTRPIKAALLDQALVAGVGNIYADESLFRAGVLPGRPSASLDDVELARLATSIRNILRVAIGAGGSTLRNYVNPTGGRGSFVDDLAAVYGRGGQPCIVCGQPLQCGAVAQRTTVWCAQCQS
ncbi:MAG: bifunctional DNA-formamidopyrimidine glycosylase/DNA-(apurinic or apyrimidinic site) lyase [Phycisphaerales bacterium]